MLRLFRVRGNEPTCLLLTFVPELQKPKRWFVCGGAVEALAAVLRYHSACPAPLGSASRWQVERKMAAIRSIA